MVGYYCIDGIIYMVGYMVRQHYSIDLAQSENYVFMYRNYVFMCRSALILYRIILCAICVAKYNIDYYLENQKYHYQMNN